MIEQEEKEPFLQRCDGTTDRDYRNTKLILGATALWGVLFVGASYLLKRELVEGPVAWAVAVVPTLAALVAIAVFSRFMKEADELHRLVQYRALTAGFAAGWLAMMGYPLLEKIGAPPADLGVYTTVMAVVYSGYALFGWRRYR